MVVTATAMLLTTFIHQKQQNLSMTTINQCEQSQAGGWVIGNSVTACGMFASSVAVALQKLLQC